jgi:hypothetical protein
VRQKLNWKPLWKIVDEIASVDLSINAYNGRAMRAKSTLKEQFSLPLAFSCRYSISSKAQHVNSFHDIKRATISARR